MGSRWLMTVRVAGGPMIYSKVAIFGYDCRFFSPLMQGIQHERVGNTTLSGKSRESTSVAKRKEYVHNTVCVQRCIDGLLEQGIAVSLLMRCKLEKDDERLPLI